MNPYFLIEISDIIRQSSESDYEKYLQSEHYFFSIFSNQKDDYYQFKEERKKNEKYTDDTWSAFLREIRQWNDLDLRFMYNRIMQLSQEFKGTFDYFDIRTDYGTYVIPDRITILNKLLFLSRDLLHEIYPELEQSLNYETDTVSVDSTTIHGKIDWNTTIINSINQSLKHPISFTSLVPIQEFDTPENLLMLVALFWLKNDSLKLLKSYRLSELSKTEIFKLQQILMGSEYALSRSALKDLEDHANVIASSWHKSRKTQELISQTNERILTGKIRRPVYRKLLNWIDKYIHFNTERFARDLSNFRIERTEDVDTMYELWILFEIMKYLDSRYNIQYAPIVESDRSFHGFQIKIGNKKMNLKYQESYQGQLHDKQTPDYTIELSKDNIPIVLDAKNWRREKNDAKDKMYVYLLDFFPKNTRTGILFFPNNTRLFENTNTPYYPKVFSMGGDNQSTLVTCVLIPSTDKKIQEQNNIVLENISKLLL